jgi:hypothetical protein
VKSTWEFVKQGKVDDSLLSQFLKKHGLKTPGVRKQPAIEIEKP